MNRSAIATTVPSTIIAFALNGGIAVLTALSFAQLATRFRAFLHKGSGDLVQAMGYTFFALQGCDLIAAIGLPIRQAGRMNGWDRVHTCTASTLPNHTGNSDFNDAMSMEKRYFTSERSRRS